MDTHVSYDFGFHDPWLVTLSILVALAASRLFLDVIARVFDSPSPGLRWLWLSASAITLGGGVWAMHFIAMLAFHIQAVVTYDVGMTTVSMFIPILVIGAGIGWLDFQTRRHTRMRKRDILTSGTLIGLSVVIMHYLGMAAIRSQADLFYIPGYVALSIAIAVIAGVGAFMLAELNRERSSLYRWIAAGIMATAIAGMHYTAMQGTAIFCAPGTEIADPQTAYDAQRTLGFMVLKVVTLLGGILGLSLLLDNLLRSRIMDLDRDLSETRSFLKLYAQHSNDLLVILDAEQHILYASPSVGTLLNKDPQTLVGELPTVLLSTDGDMGDTVLIPGNTFTYSLDLANSGTYWIEARVDTIPPTAPIGVHVPALIFTGRNVTGRQKAKAEMTKLAQAVAQSADLIFITDRSGRIEYANQAFMTVLGYNKEEIIGHTPGELMRSGLMEDAFYRDMWHTITTGQSFRDIFINRRRTGEIFYEEKTITPLKTDGVITHYISTGKDISERIQTQERLHHLAYFDALTNLPNRSALYEHLESLIRDRKPFALAMMDLDGFKHINDSLGHVMGDRFLCDAADRIKGTLPSEGSLLARLGGDEFVWVYASDAPDDKIPHQVQQLLERMALPFELNENRVYVTASIGVAFHPQDGRDRTELLRNADSAMYRAKALGKNRFHLYHPGLNARAAERLRLEADLREALLYNQFELDYQPQVDPLHHRIQGMEALLRWRHPQRGRISPADFVPLLEETGLIYPVGLWVIEEALAFGMHLQKTLHGHCPRISVNVSIKQLRDPRFLSDVTQRIPSPPPFEFEMEITETVLADDMEATLLMLRHLREIGIRVAIDDFGTGYSSLGYLNRLPADVLKIDRQFISGMPGDGFSNSITRTILELAHALGMEVVAEGVEISAQADTLRKHGCELMQGFLFHRPTAPERVVELLQAEASTPLPITQD